LQEYVCDFCRDGFHPLRHACDPIGVCEGRHEDMLPELSITEASTSPECASVATA